MYCKSCGAQLDDNAKFCTSCGTKIELKEQVQAETPTQNDYYYDEEPKKEAPRQFGYDDTLQEGKSLQHQKSNFYGKQFSTGTSGSVQFGSGQRRGGGLRKLFGLGFIVVVLLVGYFTFFGDSGPIYNLELGVEIDPETYYPTEEIGYIIESNGYVFVSYTVRDLEVGTQITAKWYNVTSGDDVLVCTENLQVDFEGESWFTECENNWTYGSYEVQFTVDGEVVATKDFEVDYD